MKERKDDHAIDVLDRARLRVGFIHEQDWVKENREARRQKTKPGRLVIADLFFEDMFR